MNSEKRLVCLALLLGSFELACGSDTPSSGSPAAGADGGGDARGAVPSPVEAVPVTETLRAAGLSAPLDIVRDEWGIPHIYGATLADVTFGQGYIVARDRFIQMDLARHQATGTV